MEDEEFEKELQELTAMLRALRRMKDRKQRIEFKKEIRAQLTAVMM